MSFDLLAEFGDIPPEKPKSGNVNQQVSNSAFDDLSFFENGSSTTLHAVTASNNDDIWAAFSSLAIPSVNHCQTSKDNSDTAETRTQGGLASAASKLRADKDPNVLFDAEEDQSEDDDFGDFETGNPAQVPVAITATKDMAKRRPADIDIRPTALQVNHSPYPQAPKSPSFRERNPFAEMKVVPPTLSHSRTPTSAEQTASPITAWPTYEERKPIQDLFSDIPEIKQEEDDEWGEFTDLPAESPMQQPLTPNTPQIKTNSTLNSQARLPDFVRSADAPPSNIPPPSILLSILPQLFNLPQSALFGAISNQKQTLKTRILSDQSTIEFLQAYIQIAMVAARIIAGRRLRWKRDTHLAQSMSISTAGGKGGMKLVGVDKSESIKETREVTEVVRVWKEQVGKLKSVIAIANSTLPEGQPHLIVPEIGDNIPVRTATTAEGAVNDAKSCIICGLKRNERAVKIDVQVEDSFGEYWYDHWGHRTCKNFWQKHEKQLKQR